jgi:O-antigen/teichoic acid export membrane protein
LAFLAKDTFFFGGILAINQIFPMLIIPVITGYFSVKEFGVYDNLLIISNLLTVLIVFGQDSAVARWFYEVRNDDEKKQMVSEAFFIQVAVATLLLIICFFTSNNLSNFYFNTNSYGSHIRLIVLLSLFLVINNFSINILKWTFERKPYAFVVITKTLLQFISLIVLIFYKVDLYEFLIVNLIIQISSSVIAFLFCFKYIRIPSKIIYSKSLISYGFPLGLIAISASLLPAIDRKIILDYIPTGSSLGIYALAMKIAAIIKLFDNVFHMAWGPFSYSIFKERDSQKIYSLVLNVYFIFFLFALAFIWIISPFLIEFFGGVRYNDARKLILPVIFGFFFNGLSGITGVGIDLSLKSYLNLIPFLLSFLSLFLCSFLLLPYMGLSAVAIGFLISNIAKYIAISFLSNFSFKNIQLNYLKYFFLTIANYLFFEILNFSDLYFPFKLCSLFTFISISVYIILDAKLKNLIQYYFQGLRNKS